MKVKVEGLTEFQKDLLIMAEVRLPRENYKIMRKIGSKARTIVARKARKLVKKQDNTYHKRWKRSKSFYKFGEYGVTVYNSAPHAHLIEYGHKQVLNPPKPNGKGVIPGKGIGEEVGFVQGRFVLEQGIKDFDSSGKMEGMLSDWLDDLLRSGKL